MKKILNATLVTSGIFFISYACTSAHAQSKLPTPESVESLFDCRTITDPAERLACFDANVSNLEEAETKGDIVVVDKETAKEIERESFGFSMPSLPRIGLPQFGNGEKTTDIILNITNYDQGPTGMYTFYLDNGQVWKQVSGRVTRKIRNSNPKLHIQSGALNSFYAQVDGKGGSFTVRRVR